MAGTMSNLINLEHVLLQKAKTIGVFFNIRNALAVSLVKNVINISHRICYLIVSKTGYLLLMIAS